MRVMQLPKPVALLLAAALVLAACGSSDKKSATPGSTEAAATSTTTVPASSTTVITAPVVTDVFPTLSLPCQPVPVPATPVTNPGQAAPVLLTRLDVRGDRCVDHVVFSFRSKSSTPPGYSITYGSPPFTADASGEPVSVPGAAFIAVTMKPAYGYDFETGQITYTGSKRVNASGANHVTEIVETGDNEGVVNWVIGLDEKRPFTVEATGAPQIQLVVTIS
jgi:hypothetical protein